MIGLGTFLALGTLAVGAFQGCSANPPSRNGGNETIGSIGLALQLGPGQTLDAVAYTITGPNNFTKTGALDVSHSTTVSGTIGGIPAGNGYTIALNGTTSNGGTSCLGSAMFNIVAGQTTMVSVHLTCHEAPTTGSVSINGTLNICPQIDSLSASPAEVIVGSSIALTASGHDTDAAPSPLTYAWTATSGTFANAAAASTSFTCTTAGATTVTLALSDGDSAANCADHMTLTVTCTAKPALSQLGHVVVIYLENHSFDNLYGSYPGAEGLSAPTATIPQIDNTTGMPFVTLPQVDPNVPLGLPNHVFDISQFVPENQLTVDLVHRYYQEQQQIDGGKMDKFVTVSDAKGLSFGYYPTATLPLVQLINSMPDQATVLDHFFHGAFGGSFLNHMWLISAQTPSFPNAPTGIVAKVGRDGEPDHRWSGHAGRLRRQHVVLGEPAASDVGSGGEPGSEPDVRDHRRSPVGGGRRLGVVRGRLEQRPRRQPRPALPVPPPAVRLLPELRRRHGGQGGPPQGRNRLHAPPSPRATCRRCRS